MEYIICHYKEVLALIGSVTGFFIGLLSLWFAWYSKKRELDFKDKEFSQRVTLEKEKELHGKKIEVYQKLYALSLKYYEQKSRIGLMPSYDDEQQYEETHNAYVPIVKQIIDLINKEIFYVSEELDEQYQILHAKYLESFKGYNALIEWDNEDEIRENGSYIYSSSEEAFYTNNKEKINKLLKLIKKEFKEKRNYDVVT